MFHLLFPSASGSSCFFWTLIVYSYLFSNPFSSSHHVAVALATANSSPLGEDSSLSQSTKNNNDFYKLTTTTTPPLIDVPTYSMSTFNEDDDNDDKFKTTNMNILTYATPVSVRPDRVWTIGLYKGTRSEENFRKTKSCILQLLTEKHKSLIPILGGYSGREIDKESICSELGIKWEDLSDVGDDKTMTEEEMEQQKLSKPLYPKILPGCHYYLHLKLQGDLIDAGSHMIAPYCKVERMWISSPSSIEENMKGDDDGENDDQAKSNNYLSTARLRELGLITEQGRAVLPENDPPKNC